MPDFSTKRDSIILDNYDSEIDKMKINTFWLRRDLRLEDNTALDKALASGLPVLPVFIFDTNITDELPPEEIWKELIA